MNRAYCFLLVFLVLPALPSFVGAETRPPAPVQWGEYTVHVRRESEDREVLSIQNKSGRIFRSIESFRISKIHLVKLFPKAPPVLHIIAWHGEVHGGKTDLLFVRRRGRVRNILIYAGNNYPVESFQDLDKDGTKEIIANSDVLAYSGMSFLSSPAVKMVLGWNGKNYEDRTLRYPAVALRQAQDFQSKLKAMQEKFRKHEENVYDFDAFTGYIAGYYGNLWVIHRTAEASKWIKTYLADDVFPAKYKEVFSDRVPNWDKALPKGTQKVLTSQKKQMDSSDWYPEDDY